MFFLKKLSYLCFQHTLFDRKAIGAACMMAGCCIGAGMLALPMTTGLVGFVPSVILFILVWWYSLSTARLLLEANSWYEGRSVNLVTLCSDILGPYGKWTAWGSFLFLFYCLLSAYFVKGGEMVQQLVLHAWQGAPVTIGPFILLGFTIVVIHAGARWVDRYNMLFFILMCLSLLGLIYLVSSDIKMERLTHTSWGNSLFLLPFLVTAFGFHNMVPSVRNYLAHDKRKLIFSLYGGSLIPLAVYLAWLFFMLGAIPIEGEAGLLNSYFNGKVATDSIGAITGSIYVEGFALAFAMTAIITSILGQGLSVIDFLMDGFGFKAKNRFIATFLAVLPPFLFSQTNPLLFFKALEVAGGITAMILYGILPVIIVGRGRYFLNAQSNYMAPLKVKGLVAIFLMAVLVLMLEIFHLTGVIQYRFDL